MPVVYAAPTGPTSGQTSTVSILVGPLAAPAAPITVAVPTAVIQLAPQTVAAAVAGGGGPTAVIGRDTIGSSTVTTNAGFALSGYLTSSGLTYTAVTGDVVTGFYVYGASGAPSDVQLAIYTVVSGVPAVRVGSATTVTVGSSSTPAWYTTGVSIALTGGVEYTVALDYWTGNAWTVYYDDPGGDQMSGDASAALPATWTSTGPDVSAVSFYASVATSVTIDFPYPASISSRKILDQDSNVYLIKGMATWALGQNASDTEITDALEGLAALGFNSVIAAPMGVNNPGGTGWSPYENDAGDDFWTGGGTPFQTTLGPAWDSVDWMMTEATRLDITVFFTLFVSWGSTGVAPDIVAATNAQMRTFGSAVATRYAAYPNIVWHLEGDADWNAGDALGQRIDYYHRGIKDVETTNRLITAEPDGTNTVYEQFISQEGTSPTGYQWFHVDLNNPYRIAPGDTDPATHKRSAEAMELAWAGSDGSTSEAFWTDEPIYAHNTGVSGGYSDQQIRERLYATFLEGGCGINYGDEWFWPVGAPGLFSGPPTNWITDTLAAATTLQASYCFTLVDAYCATTAWAPLNSFVTTGEGSGDTKAAVGTSGDVIVAYFPDNRTIVVDTTLITGSGNVRLRWFDPTAGTYSTITSATAQSSSQSVTLPAAHGDGSRDFLLVVDASTDAIAAVPTAVIQIAGQAVTAAGSGATTATVPGAAMRIGPEPVVAAGSGAATATVPSASGVITGQTLAAAGTGTGGGTVPSASLIINGELVQVAGGPVSVQIPTVELTFQALIPTAAGTGTATTAIPQAALNVAGQPVAGAGAGTVAANVPAATVSLARQPVTATGEGTAAVDVPAAALTLTPQTVAGVTGATALVPTASLILTARVPTATGAGTATILVPVASLRLTAVVVTSPSGLIFGMITCDVTGAALRRRVTGPARVITDIVTGPGNGTPALTGPARQSRATTGPALASRVVTGPARHTVGVSGPDVSRDVTGPRIETFVVTGPGACNANR